MSAYVDPRFRPTLWPGTAIPVPPLVRRIKDVRIKGNWLLWTPVPHDRELVHLPDDFYLRELMELRADDLEGAAALYASYGSLFGADREDLHIDTPDLWEELQKLPEADSDEQPYPFAVHRDVIRIYLETAQDAVATWIACQREGGLEALVEPEITEEALTDSQSENLEVSETPWPHSLEHLRELVIDDHIHALEQMLNRSLGRFSIGVGDLADRSPTVLSVAFLQLYNHLVEEAHVRRCANDNCGRDFVRQRGRAEYGQHRTTGVKYCSRECARAQAQRDLRRRRRTTATTTP